MRFRTIIGIFSIIFAASIQSSIGVDFGLSQVDITIAPGFNHTDLSVEITSSTGPVHVSTDATWVTPTLDSSGDDIILTFATSNQVASTSTATITAIDATSTNSFFVSTHLAPLNITKLIDDPVRSRIYGIQQNGVGEGAVIVVDPISEEKIGCISVGKRPTDLDVSADGSELLVINAIDGVISVINLPELVTSETITLPAYDASNHDLSVILADLEIGKNGIIYYTDGGFRPPLRVYNRTTGKVIQTVTAPGSSYGIGDFSLNDAGTKVFGWVQSGYGAGWASTYLVQLNVNHDGTLTHDQRSAENYPSLKRDPANSPVFTDNKGESIFVKKFEVSQSSVAQTKSTFPSEIYSISPGGEIVGTKAALYERRSGNKLLDLAGNPTAQVISSDYARFVYFNTSTKTLEIINLMDAVGAEILNKNLTPLDKSITLEPAELIWSPIPGIDLYDVYLGTSEIAVTTENTNAANYKGRVNSSNFSTDSYPFVAGQTYYWRVDPVTVAGVEKGVVYSFTVSTISSDKTKIDTITVSGHDNHQVDINLSAATPRAWRAVSDQPWLSFVNSTGTTPSQLTISCDASQLSVDVHSANITLYSGSNKLFSIPVYLEVEALKLTQIKSDPKSVFSYAISGGSSGSEAAYLLEINTLTEKINRVVPVGTSVTDLAIHNGDNRIYVPNWLTGSLLAINKSTFELERTYGFHSFQGTGYGNGDVYRISAGAPGRLIIEEEDQWIDVSIFDTVKGVSLGKVGEREGGGGSSHNGRYYYHGDSNSSGSEISKYDLMGDVFTSVATKRLSTSGYGSRTVVVSADGSRIFWKGSVFDPALNPEWYLTDTIYSCSSDGRLAFSDKHIFDIDQQAIIGTMPVTTAVSTYNDITSKLLYPTNGMIGYRAFENQNGIGPSESTIITSPNVLSWGTIPTATEYQIYLGSSEADIASADTQSASYLGSSLVNSIALTGSLPNGVYYWRIDTLTPYGTLVSSIHSFTVSAISTSITSINVATVQGHSAYTVPVELDAGSTTGLWSITSDVSWISFNAVTGITPATVEASLDASALVASNYTATITVSSAGIDAFSIPVSFTVVPLKLTHLKTDPSSAVAYAISENTASSSSRAYLLEIDTASEEIIRSVFVGSSVTDFEYHRLDGKIYVANWKQDQIRVIDLATFTEVKVFTHTDIYNLAAGGSGRLMASIQYGYPGVRLLNSATGTTLVSGRLDEGDGIYSQDGRYYYHGGAGNTGSSIAKFDMTGDVFTRLKSIRVISAGYYGSRIIRRSEDGQRIFWNGSVFNTDLVEEWEIGEHIYACTADGTYAFSKNNIYDIPNKQIVLKMPVSTTVSAFNTTSSKLLVQQDGKIRFYELTTPLSLVAPVLQSDDVEYDRIGLRWNDETLEVGFTLQYREKGGTWQDSTTAPTANTTNYNLTGLTENTDYEIRIKADSPSLSSPWSQTVFVTTLVKPLLAPMLRNPSIAATEVRLNWSDSDEEDRFIIQRSNGLISTNWVSIATNTADQVSFIDRNVLPLNGYMYRVRAEKQASASAWSNIRNVNTPQLPPPAIPQSLMAEPISSREIRISWIDGADETAYIIQRRNEDSSSWQTIGTTGSNIETFSDRNVIEYTEYWYRIQATNTAGNSPYSNETRAIPMDITSVLFDDFDPAIDPVMWSAVSGGVATNFGAGFIKGNALWFAQPAIRSVETIPLDLRLGGTLKFKMRSGNEMVDDWDNSEPGETVSLEYSIDGLTWIYMNTLNTVYPSLSDWTGFSFQIPTEALSAATQFRWKQASHSGNNYDVWALDEVAVMAVIPVPPAAPSFLITSANSATTVSLFWIEATGVASYVIEKTSAGKLWEEIARLPATQTYFTDVNCRPGRFYSYRVKAVNAGGVSPFSAVSFVSTYTAFEEWSISHYGKRDASGIAHPLAKDKTGIDNLTKFAFNMNTDDTRTLKPGSGITGIPAIWLNNGMFNIEYVRRKHATESGIRYTVQVCETLGCWKTIDSVEDTTSIDGVWERVKLNDSSCPDDCISRFVRVLIEMD